MPATTKSLGYTMYLPRTPTGLKSHIPTAGLLAVDTISESRAFVGGTELLLIAVQSRLW